MLTICKASRNCTWIHNTWNTWVIFKNTDGVLAGVNLPISITCNDFCFYPLPECTTYYCSLTPHFPTGLPVLSYMRKTLSSAAKFFLFFLKQIQINGWFFSHRFVYQFLFLASIFLLFFQRNVQRISKLL